MWKSRKFIVLAVILGVALVGTLAGVALAQTGTTNTPPGKTMMGRVAAILGVDQKKVEDAFAKAKAEAGEEALTSRLKGLVDSGKLTQAQADQYKGWWQSRPKDMPVLGQGGRIGTPGRRGGMGWCRPLAGAVPPLQ